MLALPPVLHHTQAACAVSADAPWVEQARLANWQIDASALAHFDSSALALLLDLRRAALAAGTGLTLHNAPARLTQLATLYGVNELMTSQ